METDNVARGPRPKNPVPDWALTLKMRRVELGNLTQEDVQIRSNDVVSQGTVSDLERGKITLDSLNVKRAAALARALNWTLSDMQRATGVDLGMAEATVVAEGSVNVYPLQAALDFDTPGMPVDHVAVAPGIEQPAVLRMDTEEMNGSGSASIRPGDYLHVDLASTQPQEGYVYVLLDRDGVHVRQYISTRLGAAFRAENPSSEFAEDIPAADAQVIGQVVAVSHPVTTLLN